MKGKRQGKRRTIKFACCAYPTYQITQKSFSFFASLFAFYILHLHLAYFDIAHCQQWKSFHLCSSRGKNSHNSSIINKNNNNLLPIAFSSFYNFYDFLIKLLCICLLHRRRTDGRARFFGVCNVNFNSQDKVSAEGLELTGWLAGWRCFSKL